MAEINKTAFAPQLYIPARITGISFNTNAFDAVELRRITNADGSIHVAELSINGAIFHLHEASLQSARFNPEQYKGTTVVIGLFVRDVMLL
ncbi:MAG: hypothetical protein ABIQ88_08510 [Chitinophagaceae bacterium]